MAKSKLKLNSHQKVAIKDGILCGTTLTGAIVGFALATNPIVLAGAALTMVGSAIWGYHTAKAVKSIIKDEECDDDCECKTYASKEEKKLAQKERKAQYEHALIQREQAVVAKKKEISQEKKREKNKEKSRKKSLKHNKSLTHRQKKLELEALIADDKLAMAKKKAELKELKGHAKTSTAYSRGKKAAVALAVITGAIGVFSTPFIASHVHSADAEANETIAGTRDQYINVQAVKDLSVALELAAVNVGGAIFAVAAASKLKRKREDELIAMPTGRLMLGSGEGEQNQTLTNFADDEFEDEF